jgi:HPt (histidine-containing phosphotransfer) domain-containing protein
MDVQMPGTDGIEATKQIRQIEKELGTHVPIVAMTAHAMAGDKEICLEAGMDEYVTKPVRPAILREVLDRLSVATPQKETGMTPPATPGVAADTAPPIVDPRVFDRASALEDCLGSEEMLCSMITVFLESLESLRANVRTAVASGTPEDLRRSAHTIKGALGTLSARTAYELAFSLEKMGKANTTSGAKELHAQFETELERLIRFLTSPGEPVHGDRQ